MLQSVLLNHVRRAWKSFSVMYAVDGPFRLPGARENPSPHVWSEGDVCWHVARLLGAQLANPLWVHREWQIGNDWRVDLAIAGGAQDEGALIGIEVAITLNDSTRPDDHYRWGKVLEDAKKLAAIVRAGHAQQGVVLCLDKRPSSPSNPVPPVDGIPIFRVRDASIP
jgi:hypothetical protein